MIPGIRLDYKELRGISPKAARRAIIQVLKSADGNVSVAARLLHTTRRTIYKALKKDKNGNLDDSSTAPRNVPNRTAAEIENKVIEIKKKTRYGPIRISDELLEQHNISLSTHTIRNILRRHKKSLRIKHHKPHKKGPRQFVDWYNAKPFEIVQIDLKHVVDQKALTMKQINHIHMHDLPLYQWGALDVNARFKLIAYSGEKSWTNGLTWFLWVTSWIRLHGITGEIIYTVDHGEEFGGKSWLKIVELRKLLSGFGVRLIQNRIKHPEENSHLERSHRTDDDEFYIPRILDIQDRQEFYKEALSYIYYYNNVRKHSGIGRITPFQHLSSQMPDLDDRIRIVPPLFLDNISVDLGPWSGYHVLAQNPHHFTLPLIFFLDSYNFKVLYLSLQSNLFIEIMNILGFSFTDIVTWLMLGGIVGYIVHIRDKRAVKGGIIATVLFGSIGAITSGYLANIILGNPVFRFSVEGLVMAGIGAFFLAMFYRISFRIEEYFKTTTTGGMNKYVD